MMDDDDFIFHFTMVAGGAANARHRHSESLIPYIVSFEMMKVYFDQLVLINFEFINYCNNIRKNSMIIMHKINGNRTRSSQYCEMLVVSADCLPFKLPNSFIYFCLNSITTMLK